MKCLQYIPQLSWKRGNINPFPNGKLRHPESGTMRKTAGLTGVSSQNAVSPTPKLLRNASCGARMIWRKMMKRERAVQNARQTQGLHPS